MKLAKSRRCLWCKLDFVADPRNAHHQKYCSAPGCRLASKAESQRLWLAKPENRNYHSGPEAVARVRDWQKKHPDYRVRQHDKRVPALQDLCVQQVIDFKEEIDTCADPAPVVESPTTGALQDFISTQPLVFIGLIAHFFNITLQDDIVSTTRSLQQLGEDVANGRDPHGFVKAGDLPRTTAAGAGAL